VVKKSNRYEWSEDFPQSVGKLHAFYGNFGILVRAYSYILTMGDHLGTASRFAVLNANYIKEGLKAHFHLPHDRPCMHECVFTDQHQRKFGVSTLDIAKRLMDYGFHPPTIYFPLVVHGAIMIEPTETESKDTLDRFIAAMRQIAKEAQETPERLHQAPHLPKMKRLDETRAARQPCLRG
jgi:glycine dehydrogenase subunit 2